MIQQGQVFKLKARGPDGRPLWAYRYRLDGRGSARPQAGGFASRAEAEEALRKALARLRPGGSAATMTVADLVEEYLGMHQAEPVTIAKLRWLLSKATKALGAVRLAELSPKEIYAWRQTVPEGHRFEATQALRQVLNRAVEWEWLNDNPAKRVPNPPPRRSEEKRPLESWEQIDAVAAQLGTVYRPMVIFAAATGLRPSEGRARPPSCMACTSCIHAQRKPQTLMVEAFRGGWDRAHSPCTNRPQGSSTEPSGTRV